MIVFRKCVKLNLPIISKILQSSDLDISKAFYNIDNVANIRFS